MSNKTKAEIEKENEMLKKMLSDLMGQQSKNETDETMRKRDCTITSLVEGKLVLRVDNKRTLEIPQQYGEIKVTGEVLRKIMSNHFGAYLNGYFTICSRGETIVSDMFTEDELKRRRSLITDSDQLRDLLQQPVDAVVDTYRKVNKMQRKIIESMLTKEIESGRTVDIRLKEAMKNASGIDFINLEPLDNEELATLHKYGVCL